MSSIPVSLQASVLLLAFTLSGAAGLVYESIWSRYLKLFLGHAAYAQTLVLVIFMGGLALGAAVAARRSRSIANPLRAFAAVEGLIGVLGLLFHGAYSVGTEWLFSQALPAIGSGAAASALKWGFATALLLPQSVLLGMSFPLIAGALTRRFPEASGRAVASLYFANSLGASAGVLASGFLLVGAVGLPGTVMTAGLVNVALAIVVWGMAGDEGWTRAGAPAPRRVVPGATAVGVRALLWVSALTGVASFMYEIAWIRMLSLVLGSTTHSFELMLSAFILGLALGSLWVRGRLDRMAEPVRALGWVQAAMALLALASLFAYGESFRLMAQLLASLERSDGGYAWFLLASHGIAMLVMLPATVCAGMTLPLVTHAVLRGGHGERGIGAVYAVNTLGAIAGVLLAVHLLMPALGVEGLLLTGVAIDLALAIALLGAAGAPRQRRVGVAFGVAAALVVAAVAVGYRLDPRRLASGVYRSAKAEVVEGTQVLYHEDGKTATVSVLGGGGGRTLTLLTNGKPDASISLDTSESATIDEPTQILLGAIPLAYRNDARRAAIIGLGSGLTTETVLASPNIERVDTIEIEAKVIEAGRWFREQAPSVVSDPRSHLHVEDAKTWFASSGGRYDIIVSEPSNPWVSGVSSLFTEEFYRVAARHLADGGVFTQWIQLYEIDLTLVASIFKSLQRVFGDYVVYGVGKGTDLVLVATVRGRLAPHARFLFASPRLEALSRRARLRSPGDLRILRVGSRELLGPWFDAVPIPANSDYFPILDLRAPRARYLGADARALTRMHLMRLPLLDMVDPYRDAAGYRLSLPPSPEPRLRAAQSAHALREALRGAEIDAHLSEVPEVAGRLRDLAAGREHCGSAQQAARWLEAALDLLEQAAEFGMTASLAVDSVRLEEAACARALGGGQQDLLSLYLGVVARDAAAMHALAGRILARAPDAASGPRWGFVVGAAMAASLALGDAPGALRTWEHNRERLTLDAGSALPLLLLAAKAAAGS